MLTEIQHLQDLLSSFLGEPKNEMSYNGQLQFPCPHCIDDHGENERHKYNLEVNLYKQKFNCWKCSSVHDEMHGSIIKLIKKYGNEKILSEYKNTINTLKKSKLYEIHFTKDDFNIDFESIEKEELKLPANYKPLIKGKYNDKRALEYLSKRGIGWDIIEKHHIGYTTFDRENMQASSRIIIPSYNEYGELNYWTGRDYLQLQSSKRQKYFNPQVERKDIIFNEKSIQWDADITLVEGPFDHIVVPNSIPLLGKSLKEDFKVYDDVMQKANAHVNIFLDGDAIDDVKKIYKLLDCRGCRLHGKVRYIPVNEDLDPSEIYTKWGYKGIIQYLKHSTKFNELDLQ